MLLGRLTLLSLATTAACSMQPSVSTDSKEILGGTRARAGDHPSVVAIFNGGLCTATLIAPDLVLTAAHCITPSLLGLGSQEQVTQRTQVVFDTDNIQGGGGFPVQAAKTIPHPNFNIQGLGDNDIGLIRLQRPVTDRAFTPINRLAKDAPIGVELLQIGYGATQAGGGGAGQLMELRNEKTVPCSTFGVSDQRLLCFSQTDGTGKCQGDSGGPSFATIGGVQRVVGVTSFGDQTCERFGADTRVDAELEFLFGEAPELQCQGEGACNEACGANGLPDDPDCAKCEEDSECEGDDRVCSSTGRCIPAPFTPGGIGGSCENNSGCDSNLCAFDGEQGTCTSLCDSNEDCESGFDCVASGESKVCWPGDDGGCRIGSGRSSGLWLLLIGLALLPLRRRRRA